MFTSPEKIAELASQLIDIKSLSGHEHQVFDHLRAVFSRLNWPVERFPVVDGRENVLVTFGTPRIIFTTHLDVVPGPDHLFQSRIEQGVLYGRGACDAKGIAATMIGTALRLRERGADNFGLLFVVGEEVDGIGARQASVDLVGRGIEYLVNGEPTECKLIKAHKGIVDIVVHFEGRACHSGYPELGIDANMQMVDVVNRIRSLNLGEDSVLGSAKVNFGVMQGGVAANVVSPHACLKLLVRTVTESSLVIERIQEAVGALGRVEISCTAEPAQMIVVPGFETGVAAYYTDIPGFKPLGAKALLYGPGTIFDAHTDGEKVTIAEIAEACSGYERIWQALSAADR